MFVRQATFPRAARLLRPSQYRAVFARGNKWVCEGFVVIAAAGEPEAGSRLGLALAKRRLRRAVDRSRVRRIVRESFRHVRRELPAQDIVVLARSNTGRLDNATLRRGLDRIWTKMARARA